MTVCAQVVSISRASSEAALPLKVADFRSPAQSQRDTCGAELARLVFILGAIDWGRGIDSGSYTISVLVSAYLQHEIPTTGEVFVQRKR